MIMEADTSSVRGARDMTEYWECAEEIEQTKAPVLLVVKAVGTRPRHECVCGDGMAKSLYAIGCAGMITDGAVRDLAATRKTNFAVFATGTVSDHASIHYRRAKKPVTLSAVTIAGGDLLVGDSDGVVLVPPAYHRGLVEACLLSRDFESRVHTYWRRTDVGLADKKALATRLAQARDEACRKLVRDEGGRN
jgi:regulator of RNase E activity RraA